MKIHSPKVSKDAPKKPDSTPKDSEKNQQKKNSCAN